MLALIPHPILHSYQARQFYGQFESASLFVDISGFTALTETLMQHQKTGAEVLTDALNTLFRPLIQAVYAYGGFITSFGGDALTAVFPLETTIADTLQRACQTGLRMQQFFDQQRTIVTPYGTFPVSARVGIGVGNVEWSILHSQIGACIDDTNENGNENSSARSTGNSNMGAMGTYFFRGTAINTCAQAEQYATQGDVILNTEGFCMLQQGGWSIEATHLDTHVKLHAIAINEHPFSLFIPPPMSRDMVKAFVLEDVLNLVAGGAQAEFRHIAVAFISFDETLTWDVLHRFVMTIMELTHLYGGYFNKLDFGDKGAKILVLFGAPVTHENDSERAADFLLNLRDRTSGVPWRAGLTTGLVYAGIMGGEERCEYTAIGDAVNLAARLMMKASHGAIWTDATLARRLRMQGYLLEPIGSFDLKGKQHAVIIERLEHKQFAPDAQLHSVPMIGRESELAHLVEWASPIVRGTWGGLIAIYGEAGIGKSRLLDALHQWFTRESSTPITWFVCESNDNIRQSLAPFKKWLYAYFDQSPTNTPEENKANFTYILDELLATTRRKENTIPPLATATIEELEQKYSFLGDLIGLSWSDSLYEQMAKEPELRFENTLYVIKTLLQATCMYQPVVLQIEDLHALDSDSFKLITLLSRTMHTSPFVLVGTSRYRDDGSHIPLELEDDVPYHTLNITSLPESDVGVLASHILGHAPMEELALFLTEKTSGNPFFIEQLALHLRERGDIVLRDDETWDIARQDIIDVPLNINAVLIARLDRLDPQIKQVVQTAAVLGREFSVLVLTHMLAGHEHVAEHVAAAETQHIWSNIREQHYLFRHALMRDAAYDMQLRARLRSLHKQAGAAIEAVYLDDLPPHYAELSYHYGKAGDTQRERTYAQLAGTYAANRFANDEAITYLSRALELTPEDATNDIYDLLKTRECVYDRQGRRDQQSHDLTRLSTLANDMGDVTLQATVALQQSHYGHVTGHYHIAIAAAKKAIILSQNQAETTLTARGHLYWGQALWSQSNYDDARQQLERALELARTVGIREVEGECLFYLGKVIYAEGDYTAAYKMGEQALSHYRALNDQPGEARTLNHLANIVNQQSEYALATSYYQQALEIHQRTGDRYQQGIVLNNLAINYQHQDDFSMAVPYFEKTLETCSAVGDKQGMGIALSNLGGLWNDQGDYRRATACYKQALPILHNIGDQYNMGVVLDGLGLLAYYQGDYQSATGYYQQAFDLFQSVGAQQWIARVHSVQALILHTIGQNEQALTVGQEALRMTRDEEYCFEAGSALLYLGHIYTDLEQMDEATHAYEQARTILHEAGRTNQPMEAVAGLARIALARGDLPTAVALGEEIARHLEKHPRLDGTDQPFRVYLTCYQVFQASNDPRAARIIETAGTLLHERAATIDDTRLRHSFLHNVPWHHILLEIQATEKGGTTSNKQRANNGE